MSSTKVKGLADLERALKSLPDKLAVNVMRGALRAGAKVLQDEARRLAPSGPPSDHNRRVYGGREGLLKDSIRVKSAKLKGDRIVGGFEVGGAVKGGKKKPGGDAYYAAWVEFGTKAHVIRARKRSDGKRGRLALGGRVKVNHPGAKPHPFMLPAMDAKGQAAVEAVREYIRKRLATKHGIDVPAPLEEGDE